MKILFIISVATMLAYPSAVPAVDAPDHREEIVWFVINPCSLKHVRDTRFAEAYGLKEASAVVLWKSEARSVIKKEIERLTEKVQGLGIAERLAQYSRHLAACYVMSEALVEARE